MDPHSHSMVEQLNELYADKEHLNQQFPGMSVNQVIETASGVREQLIAIVEESFDEFLAFKTGMSVSFPGLSAKAVIELAQLGKLHGHLPTQVVNNATDSLEAQLVELYAEKQALAEAFPGLDIAEIVTEFKDKLGKLERFYAAVAA